MYKPVGTLRVERKDGKGVDVDMRIGTTAYQIETSSDDKGYYFDIYQVDQTDGDNFSVRKCVHESSLNDGAPFDTEDAAVEAAKLWIQTKANM